MLFLALAMKLLGHVGLLCLRGLSKAHGVVTFAHNLLARTVQKLSQPADAAHEEAGVDVEEDDGRVAVRILPIGEKCGLGKGGIATNYKSGSIGGISADQTSGAVAASPG